MSLSVFSHAINEVDMSAGPIDLDDLQGFVLFQTGLKLLRSKALSQHHGLRET